MKFLIIWLILAVMVAVAQGTTYQWLDDRGIMHFTDDPDKIPGKYLKRVKERESVKGEEIPVTPNQDAPPAAVPSGYDDKKQNLYDGHDETWWRGRYAAVRNEIKRIQDALPDKKDELDKLHRKWVVSQTGRHRAAYYEKKSEMEKDEIRIKELQGNLNDLEVEAGKAGVPLEWRQ